MSGFDVVLGNPPWERIKLQEKEWFSNRAPEIANAPNAASRRRLIAKLAASNPELSTDFQNDKRSAECQSHFVRNSVRYPLCGRGDVNTYAIFAELNRKILNSTGLTGGVFPTGIATDDNTKLFFRELFERNSLYSLYDFENKNIFPHVHRSYKFCCLTASRGQTIKAKAAKLAFFLHNTSEIQNSTKLFTLTASDIALLNPNTRTCPIFRSRRDAELTLHIYRRNSVLIKEGDVEENPWGINFKRMFDMSNHSHLFRTREALEDEGWQLVHNTFYQNDKTYLPLYEAKMGQLYNHRAADVVKNEMATIRQNQPSPISEKEHQDPNRSSMPFYWVPAAEVDKQSERFSQNAIIGVTKVTSSTNSRTYLPTLYPYAGFGDSVLLILQGNGGQGKPICNLLGQLCSFPFDYVSRQKLGGVNMAFFIQNQLPVIMPSVFELKPFGETLKEYINERILELTYTAWDLESFAKDCDYRGPPFRWDEERRFLIRAELDAVFFHLYLGSPSEWQEKGTPDLLDIFPNPRDAVDYMMETFPIVKKKDIAAHGEYRTKRVILEIYDEMQQAIEKQQSYQTRLNPPPGDPSLAHPPRKEN